jgi:hypothetical protein
MQKIKAELDTLVEQFGLKVSAKNNFLSDWLFFKEADIENLDDFTEKSLSLVESRLHLEIDGWLEEELKMKLLSPILLLARIDVPEKIGLFFERGISAEFEQGKISVITDCMISSIFGVTAPKTPYFFMQEFKKSKGDKQDPEGQMLAAMIAGQYLNNNGKTMYGSYVMGRDWFFSILDGKNYVKSKAFQLTEPRELRQVLLTLRKLKQIILNDLMN